MHRWIIAVVLTGCLAAEPSPGDSGALTAPVVPETTGVCDWDPSRAAPWSGWELTRGSTDSLAAPEGVPGAVFETEPALADFLASVGSAADASAVDFDTERAVAVWHASAEGCGVDLTSWEVVDFLGHAHPLVQAAFTEGDASCAAACDGATGAYVVVVVGGTDDLPICRQVYPEC